MSDALSPVHLVPVCTRLVVAGPFKVHPTTWLACPRRGAVELATCLSCPRFASLRPDGRGAAIACHPDVGTPAEGAPTTAAGVMTRDVFCVGLDVDIGVVAALLIETGLHTVPVVDEAGCPVGMVSTADLIRAAGHDDTRPSPAPHLCLVEDREPVTAREAMRRFTAAARPDDSLAVVAARMLAAEIDHVPVVDDDGRLVGMVTAVDLARWSAAHLAR